MKLTIERNTLLNVLKHTTGIVEKRNTIPVLSNILINATKETISFVASDTEIEVNECVSANVEEAGSITIPAQTLFDIARKISNDEVKIETTENGQVSVSSGRSKFKLATLPVEDFPQMPVNEADCSFVISSVDFAGLLDKVRFAMSSDETRYYLNGVYLHSSGDMLKCASTDGHRLAVAETSKPKKFDLKTGVIIPRKTVNEVRKILEEVGGEITVSINKNKISFMIGDVFIQSKLIDGTYPDYERVIPQGNEKLLTVDVSSFVSAVDRVSVVSNEKTRGIKVEIIPCEVSLSSGANGSNEKDTIDATFDGEPMDIGFNSRYLLDVLQQIGSKEVSFMMGTPENAVLIKDGNAIYVLMPMMV